VISGALPFEEEEEVEVDHDDYDDPVLASTPPSSLKSAKSFLDDLLEDQEKLC